MECHMIRGSAQDIYTDIYKVALAVATVVSSHEGDSHELVFVFGLSVGQEREREREETQSAPLPLHDIRER